ncbi:MAG TPA: HAD-IA family hydrolase [Acidothermaceae bacterium]|jgi:HAD superfamily hydrolase (TIGR01509 family)|nr:HAD-IA family hydrolase [Acidothermaceae bacterium]
MTVPPALIFDFDGLLVDTESTALRAWREQFAVHSLDFPLEVWHRYIGSSGSQEAMIAAVRAGGVGFEDAELRAQWRQRHNLIANEEPLRPGVMALLDEAVAAGSRLGVASSATREWLDSHLDRLGIRPMFDVVCARDNGRVKPAPDIYLAAVAGLGVAADNAIAFEDSPNGIAAAKAAGLMCVAVPNPVTAALPLGAADLRVESFTELSYPELVAQLRGGAGYAPPNVQAPAP